MQRPSRPMAVVPRPGAGAPLRSGEALNWKVLLAVAAGLGALGLITWVKFRENRARQLRADAHARKTKGGKAKAKAQAQAKQVMKEPTKQQDAAIKALLQQARKQQTAGQFEESETTYRQLKELVLAAYGQKSRPYLNTLQLLTSVLISQDMYESAVEVQLEMLELAKSLSREQGGGPELTAELYTSIGDSYIRLDRIDEAFPFCERSVAEFSRFRNPPPENAGVAWWNLAIAHGRRSNYDEAEKACKQALKTLAKQELSDDEPYNQLIVCVQLTYSTILSDSGRPAEAQKMIDQVLTTLATGKTQQAVVFIRLLARTRFERGLYGDAEAYLARADTMLLASSKDMDVKELATLKAYITCDRLAILRESGKQKEADELEADLTQRVKESGLPVPLSQSKYIRVRDALLPRSTGGYRLDIQLRPVVPYTKDGKLHLLPGNHFVVTFQDPSGGKPLVSEYTLTKEDCRRRLVQFKSPKSSLPFVPGDVYTAEICIFDNASRGTQISRVLQLFSRKDKPEES